MKWGKVAQLKNILWWLTGEKPTPAAARGKNLLSLTEKMELAQSLNKIIVDYEAGNINFKQVNTAYRKLKPSLAKVFHSKRTLPDKIVLRGENT